MALSAQERRDNMAALGRFLNATGRFYVTEYDPQMQLTQSNPDIQELDVLFEKLQGKKYAAQWCARSRMPLIIWTETGFLWIVGYEYEGDLLERVHVIGPINTAENVSERTRFALAQLGVPLSMSEKIRDFYGSLPSMSAMSTYPYVQMLHYALTGETLARSEIHFQDENNTLVPDEGNGGVFKGDRRQLYMREEAVLQNIRDGNMEYQEDWERLVSIGRGMRITTKDALERARLNVVTFINLCVRAAIEGGVTPDVAYSRGDSYAQMLLQCRTMGEMQAINHAMYEDLILCVQSVRSNPAVSRQIQLCCDYISLHVEDDITLSQLASRVGYTDYYLTRKFRKEMGTSISEYIKTVRIERAKNLLRNTSRSIQDISDSLQFCSRGYFSDTFRRLVGTTPAMYREMYQRL